MTAAIRENIIEMIDSYVTNKNFVIPQRMSKIKEVVTGKYALRTDDFKAELEKLSEGELRALRRDIDDVITGASNDQ